jgi:hypothetical protein
MACALIVARGISLDRQLAARFPCCSSLDPEEQLNTGDLLFVSARVGQSKTLMNLCRAFEKGIIGTACTHAAVVYRDQEGRFGMASALYAYHFTLADGFCKLSPLLPLLEKSLGRIVLRRCENRKADIRKCALESFVSASIKSKQSNTTLHWLCTAVQRHLMLQCPNPMSGGTCADAVVRFMSAAGLWSPCQAGSFCTSTNDLLWTQQPKGMVALESPLLLTGLALGHRTLNC